MRDYLDAVPGEEGAQVGFDQNVLRLALDCAAQHVRLALGAEEFDDGGFELGFGEFHVFVKTVCLQNRAT